MEVKPNKENIITDILVELERGAERGSCLAKMGKKWQVSNRTFDRLWKSANERYKQNQLATQKAIADISLEAEKKRFKKAILTKDESLALLSEMATSKTEKSSDRVNAIKTIADLQGWRAVSKTEISGNLAIDSNDMIARENRIAELVLKATSL